MYRSRIWKKRNDGVFWRICRTNLYIMYMYMPSGTGNNTYTCNYGTNASIFLELLAREVWINFIRAVSKPAALLAKSPISYYNKSEKPKIKKKRKAKISEFRNPEKSVCFLAAEWLKAKKLAEGEKIGISLKRPFLVSLIPIFPIHPYYYLLSSISSSLSPPFLSAVWYGRINSPFQLL